MGNNCNIHQKRGIYSIFIWQMGILQFNIWHMQVCLGWVMLLDRKGNFKFREVFYIFMLKQPPQRIITIIRCLK